MQPPTLAKLLAPVTWLAGAAQLIVALVVGETGVGAVRHAEALFDGKAGRGGGCMNFVPTEWAATANLAVGGALLLFATVYGASALGALTRRPAALWLAAFLNVALAGLGFLITWSYVIPPGLLGLAFLLAATHTTPVVRPTDPGYHPGPAG